MTSEQQPRSPWAHLLSSQHPTLSPPVVRDATVTTLHDVLTPNECRAIIASAECDGFHPEPRPTDPLHRQPLPNEPTADRLDLQDPELLTRLMARLQPWLPTTLNGDDRFDAAPAVRIQRFTAPHRLKIKDDLIPADMTGTRLVLLLHLNHDVSGGNLRFANGVTVGPRAGVAVWSTTGSRVQGEPVFSGTHYLLRLDVLYRVREAVAA